MKATLDEITKNFLDGKQKTAVQQLSAIVDSVTEEAEPARASMIAELASRLDGVPHGLGSRLAIAAGAIVESGVSAEAIEVLGRAIITPVSRALVAAVRFAQHLPEEEDISPEQMRAMTESDPEAVDAFQSLAIWYRPAVATWTRVPRILEAACADLSLRQALAALGGASEGSHWLSILVEATRGDPFVILVPELKEGYAITLDGVVDVAQLNVLLTDVLWSPLSRIGVKDKPAESVMRVMRGIGPQQEQNATYSATFHLYPWQALNPETKMPEDKRYEWRAPGGTGTHSLPIDFLPRTIVPIDGVRVMILVGPNAAGGVRFTRVMGVSRMFDALKASIRDVKVLSAGETAQWTDKVMQFQVSAKA